MKKENKKQNIEVMVLADKPLIAKDKASERILEIALTAPEKKTLVERVPLNLSLVIDRSGSMDGEKLEYVKKAAAHVVDLLSEKDRVAVVIYDDTVELIVPSTFMTDANKKEAKRQIASIRSGGSTFLFGGWLKGCEQVAEAATDKTFNRTLLLTDGLANVGVTSIGELSEHAQGLFRRGVSTSCFGVGLGYDEHLLEAMASNGGGNFHFLETINAIPLVFEREFLELISVSMRDTEVSLQIPGDVKVDVSGGYQFKRSADKLKVTLGSLVVGKHCSLFLKLTFKEGLDGSELTIPVAVHARGEDNIDVEGKAALTFKLAPASEVDVLEPNKSLMERFVQVDLADKATEALKRERKGDRVGASRVMTDSLRARMPYVSDGDRDKYAYMSEQMSIGLDESSRKRIHQQEYANKKGRVMTYDYPVRLVNGVLIAKIDGLHVVVDTGSPISAGEPTEWFFLDQVHQLSQDAMGVTPDYLGQNIGTHVDILLGMDIMKKFYVTVDLNANRISFSKVSPIGGMSDRHFNYERVPLTELMGTPICHCNIAGQEVEVFVDTGARLTYVDRKLAQNTTPIGREKDFFYSVGEFETLIYKLPVKIGGIDLVLRCGEMPRAMEKTVLVTGKRGILGTEIFDRYTGCFAFPDDELILFT
jgi:Ca-activated chloride channel family protein